MSNYFDADKWTAKKGRTIDDDRKDSALQPLCGKLPFLLAHSNKNDWEVDLKKEITKKLRDLGADLIKHKPYSFNRGVNVGMTKAYEDILNILNNVGKEE